MYCPSCGSSNSAKQNYCRSCGLGLEKVALTLAEQKPSQMSSNLRAQKDRYEKLGVAALGVFGLGLAGIFLYGIVYKIMVIKGDVWGGLIMLGVMTLMSFGLIAVYLFAKANDVGKETRDATDELEAKPVEITANTQELLPEPSFQPITSVVEDTTRLLKQEKITK